MAWSRLSCSRADTLVHLWRQVVAVTPSGLAAAPLGLLGLAAWAAGNGALLNCCVDRMGQVDPGYSLTELLADLTRSAVPPSFCDTVTREFRSDPRLLAG
jgi:hypothetical protein